MVRLLTTAIVPAWRDAERRALRLLRWGAPGALGVVALGLVISTHHLLAVVASPYPLAPVVRFQPKRVLDPPEDVVTGSPEMIPVEYELEPGETLSEVFSRLGVEAVEAQGAIEAASEHLNLRRLKAGEPYLASFTPDLQLASLQFGLEDRGRVVLERAAEAWQASFTPYQKRLETQTLSGELESSLIQAIDDAGGHENLAYRMSDVLQWDLDFNRDLRVGDRFEVLYQDLYLDGEYRGVAQILAVRYENRGQVYEAYRFGEDDAYYDGEGRPLRKMFLRSPLRFSRVTSRFSHRRFHPVLKQYRPHYGVDYGAPVGTPVQVTATGSVIFAGRSGGAGRMVKVRHPNGYVTAYLHLSRYAKGVREGARVRQGQVIGYVGSSGLATGPHLDYRVQRSGRWIDPLSLKNTPAEPIANEQMATYRQWRDALRATLDDGSPLPPAPFAPPRVAGSEPEVPPAAGVTAGR